MKKKLLPLLFLFVVAHITHPVSADDANPILADTQEPEPDTTQPDTYIPLVQNYFSFILEPLGVDYLYNKDSSVSGPFHSMKKIDWRSLLYGDGAILYAIRINKSRFAFCPGLGWSTLHYVFASKNDGDQMIYPTLKRQSEVRTDCQDLENKLGRTVLRSTLKIPFIDLLLRIRFNSVLEDPKEGFHTWLGVKFGLCRRATTVVDYQEYNDAGASSVYNSHFNLKSYAWAFQAGIGYYRFGLTGGLHLTPLFEQNQGPIHSDNLRPFSFSIYVDLV